MSDIISFDGMRRRVSPQWAHAEGIETARRKVPAHENQHFERRITHRFFALRQSIQTIAQREGVTRLAVEAHVREARLTGRAA